MMTFAVLGCFQLIECYFNSLAGFLYESVTMQTHPYVALMWIVGDPLNPNISYSLEVSYNLFSAFKFFLLLKPSSFLLIVDQLSFEAV